MSRDTIPFKLSFQEKQRFGKTKMEFLNLLKSFTLSCSASKFLGGYKNFVMLSPGAVSLVHGSNSSAAH